MRERAEDERRAAERRVVGGDERDLAPGDAGALAAALVGGGERQLERRVAEGEGAELAAGVPARAEDAYRNFMHEECI